jgi:hypothetical protein
MFVLMLDDGKAYGPFETVEEAVKCDLQAMAIYSLPEYQTRAAALLRTADRQFDSPDWADARALVEEVDHIVFEWKMVVGDDLYDQVFGGPLHTPQSYLDYHSRWAKD